MQNQTLEKMAVVELAVQLRPDPVLTSPIATPFGRARAQEYTTLGDHLLIMIITAALQQIIQEKNNNSTTPTIAGL